MAFPGPWRPSAESPIYALSVAATQANAQQPTGFTLGGAVFRISNSGATVVLVAVYSFTFGESGINTPGNLPSLTFPVTGAPPVGQPGSIILNAGATGYLEAPANADSFSAIGSAAGPSIIYIQRGEGNGP